MDGPGLMSAPLRCPSCTLTFPDIGELAAHLIDNHGFRGTAAVFEARKVREAGAVSAPVPPPAPKEETAMAMCSTCGKAGHKAPTCPEKKGTAPAGGGTTTKAAKKPKTKTARPTHKKRKVKTRAANNGGDPVIAALTDQIAYHERKKAALESALAALQEV
jgi:hypothetical protein